MVKKTTGIYNTAVKIWGAVARNDDYHPKKLKLSVETCKKLLNIFHVGHYYYMVFDICHMELEFISPDIKKILGYAPNEINAMFFLEQIHPEDKPYYLLYEQKLTEFYTQLPLSKRSSYKCQHDYRIKTKSNGYIRLLHQILPLEYDEEFFYRSLVVHTDISHIKVDGTPAFSIIGLDDEPSYYNIANTDFLNPSESLFTKREKEILKLIMEGHNSKQIAGELFISHHTVNSHRKNILSKANAKTPLDLITKVIKEGWV